MKRTLGLQKEMADTRPRVLRDEDGSTSDSAERRTMEQIRAGRPGTDVSSTVDPARSAAKVTGDPFPAVLSCACRVVWPCDLIWRANCAQPKSLWRTVARALPPSMQRALRLDKWLAHAEIVEITRELRQSMESTTAATAAPRSSRTMSHGVQVIFLGWALESVQSLPEHVWNRSGFRKSRAMSALSVQSVQETGAITGSSSLLGVC